MTSESCSPNDDDEAAKAAYREKLQSLRFGSVPGGSRQANRKFVNRKPRTPSWEAGIAGEHRAGGSFMPYVDEHLAPIGVKQFAENRHRYEDTLRDLRKPAED